MSAENVKSLFVLSKQDDGLLIIKKCIEWGVIKELECPNCTTKMSLRADCSALDKYKWACRGYKMIHRRKPQRCNFSQSLRKETFFSNSHLQLWQILGFVLLWTRNVHLEAIMKEVEMSKHTAIDWGSFCREVAFDAVISNNDQKIGGPGHTVQIDESKFGKRKYNRGKRVEGQWVFGGIDVSTGQCFMEAVEDRSSRTLVPILEKYVLPGTTVVSDLWKAYDCLGERGFIHLTVNHSLHFKDPITNAHTNNIEATWNAVKTALPRFHRKKAFFPGYLAKYLFIKSCKNKKRDVFEEFCKAAGMLYKPSNCAIDQDVEVIEDLF